MSVKFDGSFALGDVFREHNVMELLDSILIPVISGLLNSLTCTFEVT